MGVYDIVLPPLLEVGLLKIWHEHGYLNNGYTLFAINQSWGGWDTQTLNTSPMLTTRSLFTGRHLILKLSRLFNSIALWYKGEYLLQRRAQLTNWCWQLHSLIKQRPCRSERSVWGKYPHFFKYYIYYIPRYYIYNIYYIYIHILYIPIYYRWYTHITQIP